MDLSNIKQLEDLTIMSDVNKRLDQGWVLINTYVNNYDPTNYPDQNTLHYVVGLPGGIEYVDILKDTGYVSFEELRD